MSTYLSIDLDYWSFYTQRSAVTAFFNKVFGLGVPLLVVGSHEQLLSDVDKSGCTHLENIDYHSDLVGEEGCGAAPIDGSWLSHVRWRSKGSLLWRCPDLMQCFTLGQGCCHGRGKDPLRDPSATGWKRVGVVEGLRRLPWSDVARVGVAISFGYLKGTVPLHGITALLYDFELHSTTAWDTVLPRLLKVDTIEDAWDRAAGNQRLEIRHR